MDGLDGSPGGPRYRAPTVLINPDLLETLREITTSNIVPTFSD